MKLSAYSVLFPVLFLLSPLWLYPQTSGERVALIPFWGDDGTVIKWAEEELLFGVSNIDGYSPWIVDMTVLPDDVPEGGYPPFQCPSPSLTKDSPYAMTGSIAPSADQVGDWTFMLYLWKMTENRLIYSDWLSVEDRGHFRESLPGMLDWFFSWIKEPANNSLLPGGVYIPGGAEPVPEDNAKLWSLGLSVGTSFHRPWVIGTMYGTVAPLRYSFLEIGMEAGFLSEKQDVDYYCLYPYLHYAGFLPLPFAKSGLYAGAGGGYNLSLYSFPDGSKANENFFAFDAVLGFILWNYVTIGYTLRGFILEAEPDKVQLNHKFSVGIMRRLMTKR